MGLAPLAPARISADGAVRREPPGRPLGGDESNLDDVATVFLAKKQVRIQSPWLGKHLEKASGVG